MEIPEEALAEFLAEANEIVGFVSQGLSELESGRSGEAVEDSVNALYRHMHSLKGASYLYGFQCLGEVSHAMETCLDSFRSNPREVPRQYIDMFYKALGGIEKLRDAIERSKSEESCREESSLIVHRLLLLATEEVRKSHPVVADKMDFAEPIEKHKDYLGQTVQPVEAPSVQEEKTLEDNSIESKEPVVDVGLQEAAPSPEREEEKSSDLVKKNSSKANEAIRVRVELLDRLMNLVGELVLVRNQVVQFTSRFEDLELLTLSQNLNVVTSDLQDEIMKTRMQPIGSILNKYQRIIRDISGDLDKKIKLNLNGTETELDKTLLEAIKDPLNHIIRNSADHGLETPDERRQAGKPEVGEITINSFHEGGQVVVEISDDGRGLDREKISRKAVEKGILTEERASSLSDQEVFELIFHPGFSTAEKVSTVSGRGVGMDVVKTNIERIGGNVELSSRFGKGTKSKMKIPLTLAIVPAMIVRSENHKFCIPQVKLVELVRVDNEDSSSECIEMLQGRPMYRLRGNLLPLVDLKEVLSKGEVDKAPDGNLLGEGVNIAVLNAEGQYFGLIVDEILDTVDIVVKPLSQIIKSLTVFSGATIMGDGSVSLILDVNGLAKRGRVGIEAKANQSASAEVDSGRTASADMQELLLFNLNGVDDGKFAIPLCLVHPRLEEFDKSQIEYSGEQRVVRYRDSILPIISLCNSLEFTSPEDETEKIPVIVVQKRGHSFGVEVREILDVVEVNADYDESVRDRPGIFGNVVVEEQVVVVIDILEVVDAVARKLMMTEDPAESKKEMEKEARQQCKILLAEDMPFFRKQVAGVLTGAGYEVVAVGDGDEAFETLKSSEDKEFHLILSDIEMPKMTGFELAEAVRAEGRFQTIPMVAVTTRFRDSDIKKGKEVGFTRYLEKLNADELLTTIDELLKGA